MSTSFGVQDDATARLTGTVCSILTSFPLRSEYPDEQRDLQPHIAEVLRQSLPDLQVLISVGGGDRKPSVNLFGTSFWPDVEIRSADKPLLGIEVKYVRPDQSASKAIAETIGQSLIYRLRYTTVVAFILHAGKYSAKLEDYDEQMRERLRSIGIELLLRRPEAVSTRVQTL
jgi:hypothetical protein